MWGVCGRLKRGAPVSSNNVDSQPGARRAESTKDRIGFWDLVRLQLVYRDVHTAVASLSAPGGGGGSEKSCFQAEKRYGERGTTVKKGGGGVLRDDMYVCMNVASYVHMKRNKKTYSHVRYNSSEHDHSVKQPTLHKNQSRETEARIRRGGQRGGQGGRRGTWAP